MKWTFLLTLPVLVSSCSSFTHIPESELPPDHYELKQPLPSGSATRTQVYVEVEEDTLRIVPSDKSAKYIPNTDSQVFLKKRLDIDVLIVPFKFRPSSFGFPAQLTTEFNGNMFVGYRIDRFKTRVMDTPLGGRRMLDHGAVTFGGFVGIGSTFISPWTTNYRTTDEYSGFIVSRGVSAMVGFKSFTMGIGLGWDILLDRDKDIWIYQDHAWLGFLVSLNLN